MKNKFRSCAQTNNKWVQELPSTVLSHSYLCYSHMEVFTKSWNSSLFPSLKVHRAHKFNIRSHHQWQDLSNSRHHRNSRDSPDAACAQNSQFLRFNCPLTQLRITLIHMFNFETNEKDLMYTEALHWVADLAKGSFFGGRSQQSQYGSFESAHQIRKNTGMDVNLFGEVLFPKV